MDRNENLETRQASAGQRGPVDHERREQIIAAADEHFRRYGYNKTTIADLARSIGLSSAYIYIFFKSKQAIGEAICNQCLDRILKELQSIADEKKTAGERIRRIYLSVVEQSKSLFFNERKLHDIVLVAISDKWESAESYKSRMASILRQVIVDGREAGEFERKTPLEETCRAISQTLVPFIHPLLLEESLEEIEENARSVSALVLRSMSL